MAAIDTRVATRALQRIAAYWGWSELRRELVSYVDEQSGKRRTVVYYVSGQNDWRLPAPLYLQINQCPIGQLRQYSVAVYALGYRICSGWYCFRLSEQHADQARISALSDLVGRSHFDTVESRRAFRKNHPECAGYSWPKIRRYGTHYEIIDAAAGRTQPTFR